MVNYSHSVVYKIICLDPEIDDIYVGSTCAFRKRKHEHKSDCNNDNSKRHNRYVYKFIRNNGGWDNWSMVVIKAYPNITNKMELLTKEMKWLKKLNATLNQNVPGKLLQLGKIDYKKQYAELNKEKLMEYKKKYTELNKTKIAENKQKYYEVNTERIRETHKIYYEQNKDKIKQKVREKVRCDCGCMICRDCLPKHRKTKKHIQLMNDK